VTDPLAFEALVSLLEAGRPCPVPVHGVSMHPFLKAGDCVHLCRVLPEHLQLGDLIAFRREDRLIVHRFAGRLRRGQVLWLRQKGDNLPGFSLIRPEDLVGRVALVVTPTGALGMLSGFGLWRNRVLGCRARLICVGLEWGQGLLRRIRRGVAP